MHPFRTRRHTHREALVGEGRAIEQVGAFKARRKRLQVASALALAHPLIHAAHECVHVRELRVLTVYQYFAAMAQNTSTSLIILLVRKVVNQSRAWIILSIG